jgi:hypothetical protein
MPTRSMQTSTLVAGTAWLVVAGYGLRMAIVDTDDDWQPAYLAFTVALLVGAALSLTVAAWATRQSGRPRLRMVGLAIGGVGVAASLVAWALPLWMTISGVGLATVTLAADTGARRALALLTAGQVVGLAAMFAGIAAEIGRRDEWGNYPAAAGIAVMVTAAITIVALVDLARSLDPAPMRRGGVGLAVGAANIE